MILLCAAPATPSVAMPSCMQGRSIDLVVHFSGNAYVGESMVRPEDYFQNITVRPPDPAQERLCA